MAEVAVLTDEQIEQMLAEAEVRLAAKEAARKPGSRSLVKHASPTGAAVATPPAGDATLEDQQTKPLVNGTKAAQELTVRIPELPGKKNKTSQQTDAGPDWFNLPATRVQDPEVKRDLQLLRLRDVLDPKVHFKKDTRKDPFPKFSQVGHIVEGATDSSNARLTRRERKRTIVEEVLAAKEANVKFKSRYDEIQVRKTSGKKGYYKKLLAQRRKRRP